MLNHNSQVFKLSRFWQLCVAKFGEKKRQTGWFIAVIAMIYFLLIMLVIVEDSVYKFEAQMFFYFAGLLTTGFVFSARYFSDFDQQNSALIAIMQPASVFEKWLLAVITVVIIYPVIYTVIYVFMTLPAAFLWTDISEANETNILFLPFMNYSDIDAFTFMPCWLAYQAICAYSLMTSVKFKKHPLLKTFVLAFCLLLLFSLFTILFNTRLEVFFSYFFEYMPKISVQVYIANFLFWVLPSLTLWLASYYAFAKRELS